MRRIAAALVIVVIAASLAACGGGDSGAAASGGAAGGQPAPAPAPVPAAPAAAPGDSKSPVEKATNEAFPTSKFLVPTAILDRLAAKQPMLIFYYDSTQVVTAEQRGEIDALMEKYRGLIDLVAYDVSTASASKDPEIQKAMELAGALNVKFQPYLLFVDRGGRVIARFSGYTDRDLLEREVLRATS